MRELADLKIPRPGRGPRAPCDMRLGIVLMAARPGAQRLRLPGRAQHHRPARAARRPARSAWRDRRREVVGSALFLRYSLTAFLRFWMARQSFDLAACSPIACSKGPPR
ncbi:hypothetical protein ACU686_28060 [Yinghuangia aomiensis]